MKNKWNYGNAYLKYPIEFGTAAFENGSKLKTNNIFNPLPEFMKESDLIFTDPPWNLGNLNSFYTKAGRDDYQTTFENFYKRLFECIREINPKVCYIEIGKEYLAELIIEMKKQFHNVTFYNSMYYHKPNNYCYVIRGGQKYKKLPLDGIDEEDIITWVCNNEEYKCAGDLCMGRGLVACAAYKAGKNFVGAELNHKRLSVALERLDKLGAKYNIIGE